jgi:solute carrier family 25 phosphate transporter 23/24/25/41
MAVTARHVAAPSLCGARAQGLVYPLDTIRTRLAVCTSNDYVGILATARRIYTNEGFTAFYRGIAPSMVR